MIVLEVLHHFYTLLIWLRKFWHVLEITRNTGGRALCTPLPVRLWIHCESAWGDSQTPVLRWHHWLKSWRTPVDSSKWQWIAKFLWLAIKASARLPIWVAQRLCTVANRTELVLENRTNRASIGVLCDSHCIKSHKRFSGESGELLIHSIASCLLSFLHLLIWRIPSNKGTEFPSSPLSASSSLISPTPRARPRQVNVKNESAKQQEVASYYQEVPSFYQSIKCLAS